METLRVVICDDDNKTLELTATLLKAYLQQQNINLELHSFTNANSCLNYLDQFKTDIIFMDIFLDNNLLGTELALRIRSFNKDAKLIFLSTSNEFATESFAANASYYLIKPLTLDKLTKALERCNLFSIRHFITVDTGHNLLTLDPNSVIALEVQNKYTHIYTANGVMKELCPLAKFQEYFKEPDFLMIHRSFIINLKQVESLEEEYFLMKNGLKAPIKTRGNKAIKDQYMQWLLDNLD